MKSAQPNNVTNIEERRPSRVRQLTETPVGQLLNEHAVSLTRLREMLQQSGFQTSTPMLSRFVNQKLNPEYMEIFGKAVAQVLPPYLIDRGLSRAEVDRMLSEVFSEGEYQPMISKRITLSREECKFFGLREDPFSDRPRSSEEVFMPPYLKELFDIAMDAIKYQKFVAILGPIGSGKTTLREALDDHISTREPNITLVRPRFFDQAVVTPQEIARTILRTFAIDVPGRTGKLGETVLNQLRRVTHEGRRVALDIDEIHRMNRSALSSLKNFFEMSSGGFQRYLGIVLFGQEKFEAILSDPYFQEIFERLDVYKLPQFQGDVAKQYLEHRLRIYGGDLSKLFDEEAIDLICANATTPLNCGNIANQAFRHSFGFDNKQVIGKAIKTKIHFDTQRDEPGYRKRS